jgi:hypothetical protein
MTNEVREKPDYGSADPPDNILPPELEALRLQLGRGLHREVKDELKEEAEKPGRLRTKLFSLLGLTMLGVFFLGMWLLWPARSGGLLPANAANPLSSVKRAMDGPESGPWISVNNREAIERHRRSVMDESDVGALAALDEAKKERQAFEAAVGEARTSDAGRRVAASDVLVHQFRLNIENPELKTARTYLDSPPRTAIPDRTAADNAAERYREAARLLRVHLAHAAKEHPRANVTLGRAIEKQRDDEALVKSQAITLAETTARQEAIAKAAADALERARREAELKRWGVVKPGATWAGTLNDRGVDYPTEVTITERTGDVIKGTNTWTAPDGTVHGLAFTGTIVGNQITWRTTRRSVGYWGKPGSVHTGIVTIDSLATSFRYPNEGSKVVGTINATLQPEKKK